MIGAQTIISVCIVMLITLLGPLVIYALYGLKNKGKGVWSAWLLGAAGFFVMQIVIRTPILSVLSIFPVFQTFVAEHYLLYCLILASTAALFELVGRYVVAVILRKNFSYEKAIAAGLGHGGIECMVLIGMTYVNNLIYILMINTGTFDTLVEQTAATGVDTTQLVQIKDTFLNSGAGIYYLAAYERILTMIFHVALSLLVCYFVSKRQTLKGLGICFVAHFVLDFVAPILNGMATPYLNNVISQTVSYVLVYIFLTAAAVAALIVIGKIRRSIKREIRLAAEQEEEV